MSDFNKPKKRHTFLKLFLVLILAAIIGFGVWFGTSLKRVGELFGQVDAAYAQMESSIEAKDYQTALVQARTAASYTNQAAAELTTTPWDIAEKIPVVGSDVSTIRSIGSISGTLSDDAVVPTLDALDQLMADGIVDGSAIDISKIGTKLDQVVELANTLRTADKVVDECSAQADNLPTSHFSELNTRVDSLRQTINSMKNLLDQYVNLADMVVGVSDTLGSLINTLTSTQGTAVSESTGVSA